MSLVFVDVDTQLDFLMPAGALYAPGAERTEPVLAKLTQFALARQIQIVATADAHAEDDLEFRTWKPHCVVGTPGQQRCSATATGRSMVLGQEGGTLAPRIVVEKQALDPFTNPHLLDLLRRLRAERYVVYGLVTEHCVAATVFGLLRLNAQVDVVADGIQAFDAEAGRAVMDRFHTDGARIVSSGDVLGM